MRKLFLLFLIIFLAGCAVDPLGATTRTDIRARTAVEIERVRKDAAIGVAAAERDAAIGVADAQAAGDIDTARAWSGILPTIVFLVGLTAVVLLVVNWRGRIALERESKRTASLPVARRRELPTLHRLQLAAKRQGMDVTITDGVAYLMDGDQVVGRRQLEG